MRKNPFFLKEWWVWRREMPGWTLRGSRLAFLISIFAPLLIILVSVFVFGVSIIDSFKMAWIFAAVCWLGILSWFSTSATAQIYQREKDIGAVQILSLTRIHPFREIVGRWAGSLICVFEGWLMGLILVFFSMFILPEHFLDILCIWAFTALWFGALSAIGIACSAAARTVTGSVVMVFSSFFFTIWAGFMISMVLLRIFDPRGDIISIYSILGLPPNPLAFYLLFTSPSPIGALLLLSIPWIIFDYLILLIASRILALGFPLRNASTAAPGPRGLMPQSLVPYAISNDTPDPVGPWHDIESFQEPVKRATSPGESKAADILLRSFQNNPFYIAYRRGFMRIYRGSTAAPGSAVPTGLMLGGVFFYTILTFFGEHCGGAGVLMVALILASAISLCEAIILGNRGLHAERDQATWPTLLVTGMRPGRVLAGKFAAAFYALSGEWTYTIPLWLIAALVGLRPALLCLMLIHPAMIAAGILAGLWLASQPRFLLLNPLKILKIVLVIGFIWIAAALFISPFHLEILLVPLKRTMVALNPFPSILSLAQYYNTETVLKGLTDFACQMTVFTGIAILVWRSAEARLSRLMQGE